MAWNNNSGAICYNYILIVTYEDGTEENVRYPSYYPLSDKNAEFECLQRTKVRKTIASTQLLKPCLADKK